MEDALETINNHSSGQAVHIQLQNMVQAYRSSNVVLFDRLVCVESLSKRKQLQRVDRFATEERPYCACYGDFMAVPVRQPSRVARLGFFSHALPSNSTTDDWHAFGVYLTSKPRGRE